MRTLYFAAVSATVLFFPPMALFAADDPDAQEQAAIESGVVAGFEWILSDDACPMCQAQYTQCRRVRLGQPFAHTGGDPDYSTVRFPPLHPNDQCSVIEILLPEYGGPADPEWGETLSFPEAEEKEAT